MSTVNPEQVTTPPAAQEVEVETYVPGTAQEQQAQTPPPEWRVVIANINPGQWRVETALAVTDAVATDLVDPRRRNIARIIQATSGANVSRARNEIARIYLEKYADEGHWLFLMDSDMVIQPDTIAHLLAAAAKTGARIIGALTPMDMGDGLGWVPNLFQYALEGTGYTRAQLDYPDDRLVQVAATGAACLMIHRDVLTEMRAFYGGHDMAWFGESIVRTSTGVHWVGEDITFCTRAVEALRERIFVNTFAHVGHVRGGKVYWPEAARQPDPNAPLAVVVPMKDRIDLTDQLVASIRSEAPSNGRWRVYVIDNGSEEKISKEWFEQYDGDGLVTVLRAPGQGIHEMWNRGALQAITDLGSRARIAFLNNDVRLYPGALRVASRAMADHPDFIVMGLNYDRRVVHDSPDGDVQEVFDICAGRYDGSGGLPGFAFLVRGEFFTGGYRFPEACKWWYGDNDLVMSAIVADRDAREGRTFGRYRVGIALNARCQHLDGGGATAGNWSDPKWAEVLEADRQAFERIWQERGAYDEASAAIVEQRYEDAARALAVVAGDVNAHLPKLIELGNQVGGKRIVELGVRGGISTVAWLAAVHANEGHLWAVDVNPVPGHVRTAERCTSIRGRSTDPAVVQAITSAADGEGLDLVFVDTDHTYELTAQEIGTWAPLVRTGGMLVFHDVAVERFDHHRAEDGYAAQPPYPVRTAVREWLERHEGEWAVAYETSECNGLVAIKRVLP